MELKQIRLVLGLAKNRHFGRAAAELGLSQSALSKNLKALEDELGVPVFERSAGDVRATEFGEAIIDQGIAVLRDVAEIGYRVQRLKGVEEGELRFGVGPVYAEDPVGVALGRFITAHPGIAVEPIVESYEDLNRRLWLREVDFYVGMQPADDAVEGLVVRPLKPRSAAVFCRAEHPLVSRQEIATGDLREFPLLCPPLPPEIREIVRSVYGGAARDGSKPSSRGPIEVVDAGLIRAVVRSSDAIAVSSPIRFAAELASGDYVMLPLSLEPLRSRGAVIRLDDRPVTTAAEFFIDTILGVDAESARRHADWIG